MKNTIKNLKTTPLSKTRFIHPVKVSYNLNGKDKQWEAVRSFDSVAILLYHIKKEAFLLVKQFRAPVYLNNNSKTFTYELCAGLVDKDKDLVQIAKEEIDEECGYEVCTSQIKKITSFYTNVGISGSCQTIFFAKIDDEMQRHNGGGINDEEIELMYLPIKECEEFIFDESKAKTPGLMFSFYWFLKNQKELLS